MVEHTPFQWWNKNIWEQHSYGMFRILAVKHLPRLAILAALLASLTHNAPLLNVVTTRVTDPRPTTLKGHHDLAHVLTAQ